MTGAQAQAIVQPQPAYAENLPDLGLDGRLRAPPQGAKNGGDTMSPWVAEVLAKSHRPGWTGAFLFPVEHVAHANRRLNEVYRDSGDNLSVRLSTTGEEPATYLGANGYIGPAELEGIDIVVAEHPGSMVAILTDNTGTVLTVLGAPHHALIGGPGDFWSFAGTLGLKRILGPNPFHSPLQPQILLQTIVMLGAGIEAGRYIEAIAPPWLAIAAEIERQPDFLHYFSKYPRAFEEFLAGAYQRAGYEVVLTPRSGDRGRDVIATRHGFGSVRILEQAKAYAPGHLVTHNDVRAMLGVLNTDPNASKGIITTTSDFQPEIYTGPEFRPFLPFRLELKNGRQLRDWIIQLRAA